MSAVGCCQTQSRDIPGPGKRLTLAEGTPLSLGDYSTTPGGTVFGTTPGGFLCNTCRILCTYVLPLNLMGLLYEKDCIVIRFAEPALLDKENPDGFSDGGCSNSRSPCMVCTLLFNVGHRSEPTDDCTRIIYNRQFLMECRNSPVAKTPPRNLPDIPGITKPITEELGTETSCVHTMEEKTGLGEESQFDMDI